MNLASGRGHEQIKYPNHAISQTGRLGMATEACLRIARAGLVAEGYRGGFGRQPRGGLPVAQARPGRRSPGVAHAAAAWADPAPDGGAARAAARAVGARSRSVWLPRRRLDGIARRRRDPADLRGALPSRRGGDPPLVRGALARVAKKAREEGRTIVWVDESAFHLLPLAVHTWAPRR